MTKQKLGTALLLAFAVAMAAGGPAALFCLAGQAHHKDMAWSIALGMVAISVFAPFFSLMFSSNKRAWWRKVLNDPFRLVGGQAYIWMMFGFIWFLCSLPYSYLIVCVGLGVMAAWGVCYVIRQKRSSKERHHTA